MIRSQPGIVFIPPWDSAVADLRSEPWSVLHSPDADESLALEQNAIHPRQLGSFEVAAELLAMGGARAHRAMMLAEIGHY